MCSVSAVGDMYTERWRQVPTTYPPTIYPPASPNAQPWVHFGSVSRDEFNALKAEVAEMKELLKAAKLIDAALGTPDCDNADKLEVLRRVADLVGVDLSDVIGPRV